jgi:hypothetical protein
MTVPSTAEIESHLQQAIFPELEQGRPGWDKPHTIAVVYYLKEIINNSPEYSIDYPVLLIAAYAHDWGYAGLFEKGKEIKLKDILDVKALHMEIGVKKISALLNDDFFRFLTDDQKERIIHLVGVHDKLSEIKDTDERILVEADTLGGLDTDLIKPFADKESSDRYIRGVEKKRIPLFITDYGKKMVKNLIVKRKRYYSSIP